MKYYTFYREMNDFTDILSDTNIKSNICTKIMWCNHLLIGFNRDVPESVLGYIVLKYGDEMTKLANKDYAPKPGVDYIPKRN
jgi:hypothetical protein